jgi:hypothetical protein
MKKLLLFSFLVLGALSASAQYDCSSPEDISAGGSFTAPDLAGTWINQLCYNHATTSPDNPIPSSDMFALWYTYTATANGELTITSDLPTNVAPNSNDTKVSILTGPDCDNLTCLDAADDVSVTAPVNFLTTITFPVVAGQTYYIMWDNFWNNSGFDFEVNFTAINCLKVYNTFAATNVTGTSVTLNWEASVGAPADGYEVEYGPLGFTQGTGTATLTSTTNSLNLTNLTASTNYSYYVRSACGSGSFSEWTAISNFTTAKICPYVSGFDNAGDLAGWTVRGGANQGLGAQPAPAPQAGPGYWFFNTAAAPGPNNNWLISPAFSLQSGERVIITFWQRAITTARQLRVTAGTANTIAAQTTVLSTPATLPIAAGANYTQETTRIGNFIAPSAGIYYFGFNDVSTATPTTPSALRIDSFSFTSVLSNNEFLSGKFSVYPNPTSNVLNIENSANATMETIELTDLNGRVVKSLRVDATTAEVNISDLAAGVYMMNVNTDQGIAVKKVVKQ